MENETTLLREMQNFIRWLREHALPGFSEVATDTYDNENHKNAFDSLGDYSSEMKKAVEYGHREAFYGARACYLKLFNTINENIAAQDFEDAYQKFVSKGHTEEDALKYALEEGWEDGKMRYYLKAKASFVNPQGQEVFFVANERHTPQDSPYVTITDLHKIKDEGLDPWQYALSRKADA